MIYEDVAARLRVALGHYRAAIECLSTEERDDFLRVAGQAELVAKSLEAGDVDSAKMGLYAFSRQVSDSYFTQPDSFKGLAKEIAEVKRTLAVR
jgi:hypothetical protein